MDLMMVGLGLIWIEGFGTWVRFAVGGLDRGFCFCGGFWIG